MAIGEAPGKEAYAVETFAAPRAQVELTQRQAHDKSIQGVRSALGRKTNPAISERTARLESHGQPARLNSVRKHR
jgi:hypothetical protein